jgi:hypothetical protein
MQFRRGSFQSRGSLVPATITFLAAVTIGCASAPTRPAQPLVEVSVPPPGCQKLGEVEGLDEQYTTKANTKAAAQKEAFDKAATLGATHVQVVYLGEVGMYTTSCKAIAYQCESAATPSQVK